MDGWINGLTDAWTDSGRTVRGFNIMPPDYIHGHTIKRITTRICTTIHRYPIFSTILRNVQDLHWLLWYK